MKAVVMAITIWLFGAHSVVSCVSGLRRALFLGSLLLSQSLSTFPRSLLDGCRSRWFCRVGALIIVVVVSCYGGVLGVIMMLSLSYASVLGCMIPLYPARCLRSIDSVRKHHVTEPGWASILQTDEFGMYSCHVFFGPARIQIILPLRAE